MLYCLAVFGLLLLYLLSFTIIIISFVFIYLTISCNFMHSSPSIPTCGEVKKNMLQKTEEHLQKSTRALTVIDLGSGWGTLLIPLAQKFPQHHFIGYEISRIPLLFSKLCSTKLKNLQFFHQNILQADISTGDIFLIFLLPNIMDKLTKKFQSEAKKGALLYSNRFKLSIKEKQKISCGSDYESIYVYKR